jgi:hypothetical protein
VVNLIRTQRRSRSLLGVSPQDRKGYWGRAFNRAACLLPICPYIRYKGEYPGFCLYMRQRVRIVCGEDRKDE